MPEIPPFPYVPTVNLGVQAACLAVVATQPGGFLRPSLKSKRHSLLWPSLASSKPLHLAAQLVLESSLKLTFKALQVRCRSGSGSPWTQPELK